MLSHQQPVIGWKGKSSGRWVGNGHGKGQHLRVDLPGDMAGSGDVPRHLASRIRPHREGRSAGAGFRNKLAPERTRYPKATTTKKERAVIFLLIVTGLFSFSYVGLKPDD